MPKEVSHRKTPPTFRSRRTKHKKPPRRKPWVKNLYENRDYPDNYTDAKFLEHLRKNLNVEKVTLKQAVYGSFRVALRVCLCVLYSVVYFYMYNGWVQTYTVIYIFATVTLFSYLMYIFVERGDFFVHMKTVIFYLVLGYLLSPILHTLTDTVSTDTIYAWAVIMMVNHLIFFDYGAKVALVSKSVSINTAIFASVCLVSRLSTPFDAFVLLTVSVIFFVLSPQLFEAYLYRELFVYLFLFILSVTLISLYTVSKVVLCYFVLFLLFLCVYCPVMFVKWQIYKDNINGPWDEAVIDDPDDLDS